MKNWEKKKYNISYDYTEYRLLNLRKDYINSVGELDNYDEIPIEYKTPLVYLHIRYRNVMSFINALNEIKSQVNEETQKLIDLLYLENKPFEEVSKTTNIKIERLKFRHKMLVDEVMEQMYIYNGPKRRYSGGKRRKSIPKYVQKEVRKRDRNSCTRCNATENLHFHHKIRYAEGGQDTVDNLILLCVKCHAEEHKGESSYHLLKAVAER